jgi:hypothetical protein
VGGSRRVPIDSPMFLGSLKRLLSWSKLKKTGFSV